MAMPAAAWAQRPHLYDTPGAGGYSAPPPPAVSGPNVAALGRGASQASSYAAGYTSPYAHPMMTAPSAVPITVPSYVSSAPYAAHYPRSAGPGIGVGYALQGRASVIQASGQYYQDVQQARVTREQSRQAQLETARMKLEFERDYERNRLTVPKLEAAKRAAELDLARKGPPRTEIWSGKTLNVLLRSVLASPSPTKGPYISLESDAIRGLNLTDNTSKANLTLTKDEGRIYWTEALDGEIFDVPRDRFSKNFAAATKMTKEGESPDRKTIRELREDLGKLDQVLTDRASDFSMSRYIESRRLLNQLKDTVKGLSDPRIVKASQPNWRKNVSTVSDLVDYCVKHGVEFGPTGATGDEAAYTSAYYALRAYERGIATGMVARE